MNEAGLELDDMKKRLKEMEDEASALREMQAKVEKEMGSVQVPATAAASQNNKEEVDSRSVFVGNLALGGELRVKGRLTMATESTITSNTITGERPKVVVIMGPTASGKSKLAVDLASHFPIEVINADSMQVYRGLDVLANKLPLSHQKGVLHHLLGTVSPNLEFTAKAFRDSAIPIIDDILARKHLPVIVGGTNYYIQALVSTFLLDDSALDMDESCLGDSPGIIQSENSFLAENDVSSYGYDMLKDIDPVAANRIHPNNHRKINQYVSLYTRTGVLPSKVFQGKAAEGRIGVKLTT